MPTVPIQVQRRSGKKIPTRGGQQPIGVPAQVSPELASSGVRAFVAAAESSAAVLGQAGEQLTQSFAAHSLREIERRNKRKFDTATADIYRGLNDLELDSRERFDFEKFPAEFDLASQKVLETVASGIEDPDVRFAVLAAGESRRQQQLKAVRTRGIGLEHNAEVAALGELVVQHGISYGLADDDTARLLIQKELFTDIGVSRDQGRITEDQKNALLRTFTTNAHNTAVERLLREDPAGLLIRLNDDEDATFLGMLEPDREKAKTAALSEIRGLTESGARARIERRNAAYKNALDRLQLGDEHPDKRLTIASLRTMDDLTGPDQEHFEGLVEAKNNNEDLHSINYADANKIYGLIVNGEITQPSQLLRFIGPGGISIDESRRFEADIQRQAEVRRGAGTLTADQKIEEDLFDQLVTNFKGVVNPTQGILKGKDVQGEKSEYAFVLAATRAWQVAKKNGTTAKALNPHDKENFIGNLAEGLRRPARQRLRDRADEATFEPSLEGIPVWKPGENGQDFVDRLTRGAR